MMPMRHLAKNRAPKVAKKVRGKRVNLAFEILEQRTMPALFTPLVGAADGTANSLRDAISAANANGLNDTIQLSAGTYELTIPNSAGQENLNAEGDLDILADTVPGGQTITIQGQGAGVTFIDANSLDRVLHVVDAGVTLILIDVTILGGVARDAGGTGVLPGTEMAEGGGLLFFGDFLSLDGVTFDGNTASGGDGAGAGAGGQNASGGAIYYRPSSAASLSITNSSFVNNKALGGDGADGADATAGADAGVAGPGGGAGGGAIFADGLSQVSTFTISDTNFDNNSALAGSGGSGGSGIDSAISSRRQGSNGAQGGGASGGAVFVRNFGDGILQGATFSDNLASGGLGSDGGAGANSPSGSGGSGGGGGAGGRASGGGLYFALAGDFSMTSTTLNGNRALGADGGSGGAGGGGVTVVGAGGDGAVGGRSLGGGAFVSGGTGSTFEFSSNTITANLASAGSGGSGSVGGTRTSTVGNVGGLGGGGASGNTAEGGGLWIDGDDVTIILTTITANQALAGAGGGGGDGGDGGSNTGIGGVGGTGGAGGSGGTGGRASGAGVLVQHLDDLTISESHIDENRASGGGGGDGGAGGAGGVAASGTGGAGGQGGDGGAGGDVSGGGMIDNGGDTVRLTDVFVLDNNALAGIGGSAGAGGNGAGVSGAGGNGGSGEDGGTVRGAGLFIEANDVEILRAVIAGNFAEGGTGGDGGQGGNAGTTGNGTGGLAGLGRSGGGASGGGIFHLNGSLSIDTSTIDGNGVSGGSGGSGGQGGAGGASGGDGGAGNGGGLGGAVQGGGISASGGTIFKLIDSTVSRNDASGGSGGTGGDGGVGGASGGDGNDGGLGGNAGATLGGGIHLTLFTSAQIVQSTISTNTVNAGGGGDGGSGGTGGVGGSDSGGGTGGNAGNVDGGGIWVAANSGVQLQIFNSTIAFNSAFGALGGAGGVGAPPGSPGSASAGSGGGIYSTDQDGNDADDVRFESTIIAQNVAASGTDFFGDLDLFFSLLGDDDGGASVDQFVESMVDIDPLLGPLENNGGPTETHQLTPLSPAIDSGSNPLGLVFDQRGAGFPRTIGSQTDIGALESHPVGILVVGSGRGSRVKVFNALTGAPIFSFLAFGKHFHGGVRVATGDFNGDDVLDIVAARGPGRTARVRVFDGTDPTTILRDFRPLGDFQGGLYVATGHFNGDDVSDIVLGRGNGPARVLVIDGADTDQVLQSFFAFGSTTTGVRVAAGDFNDDQVSDIVASRGPGNASVVRVFDGASAGSLLFQFSAYAGYQGGLFVAAGDLDGDGIPDIIVGRDAGAAQIRVFDGSNTNHSSEFLAFTDGTNGVRVGVTDADGDGLADIIAARGPGSEPLVRIFDGLSFDQILEVLALDAGFTGGLFVSG